MRVGLRDCVAKPRKRCPSLSHPWAAQVLELSRTMFSLNVTATPRRRSWPSLGGGERTAGAEIIGDGVERQLKHNSLALTGAHT
jgi:hypothetical protein